MLVEKNTLEFGYITIDNYNSELLLFKIKKMKTGAIIFSRMNSKRLPGKALKLISGKPLIEWVVDRVKQIRNVDHICIATTKNAEDDLIEEFATSKNIDFYRGKDKDVAHRALGACLKFNYKNFLEFVVTDLLLIQIFSKN